VVDSGLKAGVAHHNPGDVGDIREIAALAAMVKSRHGLPTAIALANWKIGMISHPQTPERAAPRRPEPL
jgi:hypothetical protein